MDEIEPDTAKVLVRLLIGLILRLVISTRGKAFSDCCIAANDRKKQRGISLFIAQLVLNSQSTVIDECFTWMTRIELQVPQVQLLFNVQIRQPARPLGFGH